MRIEIRDGLDPRQRVGLANGVEAGDRVRYARPHLIPAGVRNGHSNFAFSQSTATRTQCPHPLCRGCRRDSPSFVHERDCNA